jgi:hypothetical protein
METSEEARAFAEKAEDKDLTKLAFAWRATVSLALGDVSSTVGDLKRATELEGGPLRRYLGICEAEGKLLRGDGAGALIQTQGNRQFAVRYSYNTDRAVAAMRSSPGY